MDDETIQREYDRILEYARAHYANESDLISQSTECQKSSYRMMFQNVLDRIPLSLKEKTVADFGCKYGHLLPLLFKVGVRKVIGIEALDQFIRIARDLFKGYGERVEFVKCERGYIPLQPETVDVVIMNEVISHVNPTYIPVAYSETARILTVGGMLFVSDGNNSAYPERQSALVSLYDAIENGPEGTRLDCGATVQVSFVNQRKAMIRSRYPSMEDKKAEYLAKNTSGLFGDYLCDVIDHFARTGELIRRPHRRGIPPTYPDTGQVEERGFYPEQVEFELMKYGFECKILDKPCRPPGERVLLDNARLEPASGYGKYAYQLPIPNEYPIQQKPPTILLEGGHALPHSNVAAVDIAEMGGGRYCIWFPNGSIYLSASDNTDPRRNGRKYELYWTTQDMLPYARPGFQIAAVKTH
ncbi:MAG: class I SAM-dependent methyltransferase [Candidatus Bathyarchaeia archaeon]|jgi:SAM-dependent methyltransferase